jgi:hypothetical protein
MMNRQIVPKVALALVVVGGLAAALEAQIAGPAQQEAVDFTAAAVAEVRNAQGQVILSGKFVAVAEEDDDIERKAALKSTGVDTDAVGEAEVEVEVERTGSPRQQEVEFAISNVQPGAVFTFVIDGKIFATVTADGQGRAQHEREVPMPVKPASR